MITIIEKNDADFVDLFDRCWSGAIDTLNDIDRAEKGDELMLMIEELFGNEVEDTELNDWLWFDRDMIYDSLGLDANGELIEESEE